MKKNNWLMIIISLISLIGLRLLIKVMAFHFFNASIYSNFIIDSCYYLLLVIFALYLGHKKIIKLKLIPKYYTLSNFLYSGITLLSIILFIITKNNFSLLGVATILSLFTGIIIYGYIIELLPTKMYKRIIYISLIMFIYGITYFDLKIFNILIYSFHDFSNYIAILVLYCPFMAIVKVYAKHSYAPTIFSIFYFMLLFLFN